MQVLIIINILYKNKFKFTIIIYQTLKLKKKTKQKLKKIIIHPKQ